MRTKKKENCGTKEKTKISKLCWLILGFIGLGMGAVGAVLPLLPAFPFLMLALFSFGKSSEKLHRWFIGTKLYKNNLESFVRGQGMTWKTKIKIMLTVTLLMGFGFFMMFRKALYIPCAILGAVWLFHILYFIFGVKKYQKEELSKREDGKPHGMPTDALDSAVCAEQNEL